MKLLESFVAPSEGSEDVWEAYSYFLLRQREDPAERSAFVTSPRVLVMGEVITPRISAHLGWFRFVWADVVWGVEPRGYQARALT